MSWSKVLASWVVLAGASSEARAHGGDRGEECAAPSGVFTSFLVTGAECTSPVGFCTRGLLTGDLPSTYDFVMLTQVPAPTPEHPSRVVYTGQSTIETAIGTMFGVDSGEMWFEGPVLFVTTVGVIGGDECFDGVSGTIVAEGEIDLATGNAVGTYTSELCDARECFDDDVLDVDPDDDRDGHGDGHGGDHGGTCGGDGHHGGRR